MDGHYLHASQPTKIYGENHNVIILDIIDKKQPVVVKRST